MRSYELYFQFNNYSTEIRYFVNIYQQPWYRRLIARAYCWYDMRIIKMPGFKKLDSWHHTHFGKGDWTFLSISVRQDLRCFELRRKDKVILATFEVDRETYLRLGGAENTPTENESVKEAQ